MNKAIIATRFSSEKQIGNTSTEVQLESCLSYCKINDLEVVDIRKWEAESADSGNVKRLLELIDFCRKNKNQANILVVFKLDRFARDISEHYYLKKEIGKFGFRLRSATEPIDETPNGQLMEGIISAFAQFDNSTRKQRVKSAQEKLLERGIFPWQVPTGYINKKNENYKAGIGIIDENCFKDIKSVFENFSTGNYTINSLSQKYKNKTVFNHKGKLVRFYPQFIQKILNTKYYAGILVAPEYCKEKEYQGKHIPMVSVKIYNKCQEIMNKGKLKGIKHISENDDFPVRDRLFCGVCGKKMTAAWCGHKESKIALYYCHNTQCSNIKKSISKKDLEIEFKKFISTLKIKDEYVEKLKKKLIERYEVRKSEFENDTSKTLKVVQVLTTKKQKIMDMIESGTYSEEEGKERLEKIKSEIDTAKLSLTNYIGEEFKIEYLIEHAKRILLTLKDFWYSADYSTKLKIQRKFFPENIVYSFPGFSNTKLSPILESLEVIATENTHMLPRMDSNHSKQLQRLLSYH